jgi:acetyltransferase EpsM
MTASSRRSSAARPLGAILGAGAQGRVIASVWRRAEPDRRLVFLDDDTKLHATRVQGIAVEGPIEAFCGGHSDFEAIIAVGNNLLRARMAERLAALAIRFANVVDPSAAIMADATLGIGVFVGPLAVIHTGARIGDHAIVNTGAIVEHDCVLGPGANVSPGVRMGGRVIIHKNAFIATGATLVPRVVIGENAIVGAGAVVTRDVPDHCVVYGCPARIVRNVSAQDWPRLL